MLGIHPLDEGCDLLWRLDLAPSHLGHAVKKLLFMLLYERTNCLDCGYVHPNPTVVHLYGQGPYTPLRRRETAAKGGRQRVFSLYVLDTVAVQRHKIFRFLMPTAVFLGLAHLKHEPVANGVFLNIKTQSLASRSQLTRESEHRRQGHRARNLFRFQYGPAVARSADGVPYGKLEHRVVRFDHGNLRHEDFCCCSQGETVPRWQHGREYFRNEDLGRFVLKLRGHAHDFCAWMLRVGVGANVFDLRSAAGLKVYGELHW